MAYRERQKISQMTPKGANLDPTDLIEISELVSGSYVTKSITGQEIINAASGGIFVPYTGATQDVDLGEYELKAGQLTLDTTPTGTPVVSSTNWNDTAGVTQTLLKGGNVTIKNGVDLVARVVNKVTPNATLTKANYTAVKVSGAQGQRLAVDYAQANNDLNSADTIGLVTETIATNQEGFIITVGQLEEINTTGSLQSETWSDGDVLYLSPTVPGALTNIKPNGLTGHIVVMGYVEYAHAVHGKIYVKIMNGWELDELHNVYINTGTLTNNDALIYESSTQLWKNKPVTESVISLSDITTNNVSTTKHGFAPKAPNDATKFLDGTGAYSNPTPDWVDYSATSTIVGWSSFTTKFILYKKVGKQIFVNFSFTGISNSTIATFTLPDNNNATTGCSSLSLSITNNGTASLNPGRVNISTSTNVVDLYQNRNQIVFTASGTKVVSGQFFYFID